MERAERYPVTVIDNWASPGLVRAVNAEWPDPSWRGWHTYYGENSHKRASKDSDKIPKPASILLSLMAELEPYELPDAFPDLELHGAGLHEIPTNGLLASHLDSDTHPQTGWKREANAILFVSGCDGGELVFEETGMIVEPVPNRLVVFRTSDDSWHRVNRVTGGNRRSLSMFWWSECDIDSKRMSAKFRGSGE